VSTIDQIDTNFLLLACYLVFKYFVLCFLSLSLSHTQLYQHLVQHMIQRQLSKKLATRSLVAQQYRQLTSKSHLEQVVEFLKHGMPVSVQAFDELLRYTILLLTPEFKRFLLFEPAGVILRNNIPEMIAEVYHVAAVIIQCMARRKRARRRVKEQRAEQVIVNEAKRIAMLKNRPVNFSKK
jgi:hypothetical protein